jgi:tartrate-resistant acid phosphatase type 5
MPVTCPTGPCLEETCCPPSDWSYLADEVVIYQIADFGQPSGDPASVAAIINADTQADIVLAVGDCSYTGNYATDVGAFYGVPWLSRSKFLPCPGNHDWDNGSNLAPYLAYFSFLNGSRYYSRKFGIVEVFMLDDGFDTAMVLQEPDGNTKGTINADGTLTGGSAQWRWFVRSVQASTAIWKIACFHHPPWASGNSHVGEPGVTPNGSNVPLQWQFKELGIDLVLSGHEHSYERLLIDTVTYIVNGLGGINWTGFGTPIAGSVVRYTNSFGALRLRITPNTLTGDFKTASSTPDTFTLTK